MKKATLGIERPLTIACHMKIFTKGFIQLRQAGNSLFTKAL